jgi:Predicted flavoprotein involved in K+ transport
MADNSHYDVLIIGGGAGGLAVASALKKTRPQCERRWWNRRTRTTTSPVGRWSAAA